MMSQKEGLGPILQEMAAFELRAQTDEEAVTQQETDRYLSLKKRPDVIAHKRAAAQTLLAE